MLVRAAIKGNKYCEDRKTEEPLYTTGRSTKWCSPRGNQCESFSGKETRELSHDLNPPFLTTHSKDSIPQNRDGFSSVFITALLTIARKWTQTR